jgi:hypothetical protein
MPKKEVIKQNIPIKPKKIIKKTNFPINQKKNVKKTKDVNLILVENFVALQKVMTNQTLRFDELSTQISKLLELFEISAKTIAEKNHGEKPSENKTGMEGKLDNLLEQNKVIARGLSLLHETPQQKIPPKMPIPRPRQPPQMPPQSQQQNNKIGEYQKSISSKPEDGPK